MEERLREVLNSATEITSGTLLDDINTPFRIFAGPGAGKTYWLAKHIKRVIKESDQLGPSQRVASISYTTVAADEVKERLGSAAAHVDVSTIHSFLYRNIVKPYLPWVRDENEKPLVDYRNVDGHRPHRTGYGKVRKWFRLDGVTEWNGFSAFLGTTDTDPERVYRFFESLYWEWSKKDEQWQLAYNNKRIPHSRFPRRPESLYRYKQLFWRQGILDHEDVLYFAVRILGENPGLVRFLSARYPYVFVDEFQDTTPAQTEVLTALAEAGTVTGVIGDVEQSIFEFAGANPTDLLRFEPDGQVTYRINTNRRSTLSILRLLNHIRKEGAQKPHIEEGDVEEDKGEGELPVVLVGSPEAAQSYVRDDTNGDFQTLTRTNAIVRRLAGANLPGDSYDGVWENLFGANPHRSQWLEAVLEATHEAKEHGRYGQAVKILYRGLRTKNGKLIREVFTASGERRLSREKRRRTAASLLSFLLSSHEEHREMNGLEFYLAVRDQMGVLLPDTPMVEPTRGGFVDLLQETSYKMLYATARLESGSGKVKTIHKAKGEQYPTVLSYRGKKGGDKRDVTLDHLLSSEAKKDEERRVTYVAFSRAEDRLFICVDELSSSDETDLETIGVVVERLDGTAAVTTSEA